MEGNDLARVEWLRAHGARLDAFPAFAAPARGDEAEFTTTCFELNEEKARTLLVQHPEYRQSHVTMFAAAEQNRADVVEFLLQLGVPIDVADSSKQQALHVAASSDAFEVVTLLLVRGADQTVEEANWNNTPIDHAIYGNQTRMIELLSSYSHDVFRVVWVGNVARLRELLRLEPELARKQENGETPLMWLPDDEGRAVEIVTLLLAHGADASVKTADGKTAAYIAAKRGLDDAALLLRSAGSGV